MRSSPPTSSTSTRLATMRIAVRHLSALVLVLLVACVAPGCGDDARTPAGARDAAPTDSTSTAPEESPSPDANGQGADQDDEDAPPTAAEVAAGRGLDQLVAAFSPVSERINYLVAAETLRDDAVDGNAGEAVETERAGVVRIEAERMTDILADTRPKVAAVRVRTTAQQQVQQLLLEAIDVRSRAMGELRLALQARGTGLGDSVVKERFATWNASWDESLRATREATTTMQAARAELGLDPAIEEALR